MDWINAIRVFRENPFGVGFQRYLPTARHMWVHVRAHPQNDILGAFVSIGIFGGIVFLALWINLFVILRRSIIYSSINDKELKVLGFGIFVVSLVFWMTEFFWTSIITQGPFWGLIGVLFAQSRINFRNLNGFPQRSLNKL
jgi:O-antigen ligase